jgi:hypothetical protein
MADYSMTSHQLKGLIGCPLEAVVVVVHSSFSRLLV